MNDITRSRVAAVLLVLGPLALALGDLPRRLVVPPGPTALALTQAAGSHPGVWLAAGLLNLFAGVALVPGILALVPAPGRGSRLTLVGAAMVAVGAVAAAAHAVAFYSPYALFGEAATTPEAIIAIDDASEAYPLLVVVIALFMVGLMLGSLVLMVGLRRARRVPIWAVVAVVVFIACGATDAVVPGLLGVVAAVVAFVPAARSLLVPAGGAEPAAAQPVRQAV